MSLGTELLARLRRAVESAGRIGVAGRAGGQVRPPDMEALHDGPRPGMLDLDEDPRETDVAWRGKRGQAPGLEGQSGRIALLVGEAPVGALRIDGDGAVSIVDDVAGAAATISVDSKETLAGLLSGELAPIVMELQGRARVAGDARFALDALYGLQAGSPWTEYSSPGRS